jgi:hypothetical protein
VRIRPPERYIDEFYDLDDRALTLPAGVVGQEIATWWKTASAEDRRELLHSSRDVGLETAFLSSSDTSETPDIDDLLETDDDDEDLLFSERFGGDPDEYEEDYA